MVLRIHGKDESVVRFRQGAPADNNSNDTKSLLFLFYVYNKSMKRFSLLICALLALAGCSSSNSFSNSIDSTSSHNSGDGGNFSSSQNVNEKYVPARRVFDMCYETLYTYQSLEDLTFDEFPGVTFEANGKNYNGYKVQVGENVVLYLQESFYLADVNQDGHLDICYCYSSGSGIVNFGVSIYDYFNKTVIFDKVNRSSANYMFDLDDSGYLVFYDLRPTASYRPYILNEASRFLKTSDGQISMEAFNLDLKYQGFSAGFYYTYEVKKGSSLRIDVVLAYVHNPGVECQIKKEDVYLLDSDGRFTYSVSDYPSTGKDFIVEITPTVDSQTRMDVTIVIFEYSYTFVISVV